MNILSNLKNSSRVRKLVQRVGRGVGSKRGKTSTRGHKGQGSRRGSRMRYSYEGGQMRLFRKLPHRGFTRGKFIQQQIIVNFNMIDKFFNDGDTVNPESLLQKGLISSYRPGGLKILAKGDLNKKVRIEADAFSQAAVSKLEAKKIAYKILEVKS
jgi:large subunit ribosomal protein L15